MRAITIFLLFLFTQSTYAQNSSFQFAPANGTLISQADGDDTYDPFADYSEFEESSEEEADINFFRNGRFFNIGFLLGPRTFTQTMGQLYGSAPAYGLFISYFFDLRFAIQVSFATGDHKFEIVSEDETLSGNVSLTTTSFSLKYYFNTQNVTRGLADLNPYLIGGISQHNRTFTVLNNDAYGRDGANGVSLGAGLEIPMLRNKMYFGIEGAYHMVNFPDANSEIIMPSGLHTGIYPNGGFYTVFGLLGINF